ncbi:hypothetical protein KY290_025923 [Solanum tuberosum]|uniref:Uncharacterized protein ycf68 n=2 Tax=Magnoliopsida TaxID=3398 RepID=A0ABQ7UW49_SOLTU|nr:hypothetical protein KY284_024739 [Solanum tuberosum]KAH0755653.1 hypothetical protein KY290_025923 [Solanum tuberosum]
MDRPHHLYPVGTTRFGIQGSRTDHRTLFNKWNALAVRSQVGQSGSEKGNDSFLKPAFLRPKSRAEEGESPPFLNQSGDLRGGGLPCGGCQRFESAYLQLVNLADTKLYDSTQFFRFGGSIYDLSFLDVDKIHTFSSTLGWHSLKSEGRGSNEERLTAKQPECCTLDGESPVAESITSLRSDPSSMGHVESRVNQQGLPCKAKYSWVTDSEAVAWLREPTGAIAKASLHRAIVTAYGPEPGGEMPLEPRASWFSPKCVEAQQLTGHLGGSRSASETMGNKLHRQEGNSPDHQLRPLNDRSVIKEVGVQRQPGGPTGQGTVSGRQFLWGIGLPKGNGGMQRFPRAGRRLALKCKGRRELDCKTHPSSRDKIRP